MRSLGNVMFVITALLVAGCGDDDDDDDDINDDNVATFNVTLTTSQETPSCEGAGFTATGTASIAISDDDQFIQVNQLTFTGLSGPATAALIHQGAIGVTGPFVFSLDVNVVPFGTVAFDAGDFPTPAPVGASPDFRAFADAMRAGDTYINVYTSACPDGEIRAQIQ